MFIVILFAAVTLALLRYYFSPPQLPAEIFFRKNKMEVQYTYGGRKYAAVGCLDYPSWDKAIVNDKYDVTAKVKRYAGPLGKFFFPTKVKSILPTARTLALYDGEIELGIYTAEDYIML